MPPIPPNPRLTATLDRLLDTSVVLGYTRVGLALRRRWWPADPAPGSMVGKRVVVTGATSGIGEAMAASFVELGAAVHVLSRNPGRVAASARALRLAHPGAEVHEEVCDVGDLEAVRRWAGGFTDRWPALHGLVHNAGVMPTERGETAQGHELALAAHVLGPHLMADRLLDTLAAAAGASVVWMGSGGMYGTGLHSIDADSIESRAGTYSGVRAYARTKRMQVVLADAWAERLRAEGRGDVRVESMHPGWADTESVREALPGFSTVMGPLFRSPRDGADTAVWLVATRPESVRPHFWQDRVQRPTTVGWQRDEDPAEVRRLLDYVADATGTTPVV